MERAVGAEADRLLGIDLRLRVQAQKAGVEVETACRRAAQAGEISPEDAQLLRLALGGDRARRGLTGQRLPQQRVGPALPSRARGAQRVQHVPVEAQRYQLLG